MLVPPPSVPLLKDGMVCWKVPFPLAVAVPVTLTAPLKILPAPVSKSPVGTVRATVFPNVQVAVVEQIVWSAKNPTALLTFELSTPPFAQV